ncbi:dethiobiotin synthase [Sphingobium aquiterrae]|uniref:dethiobiotin synthase n=1 Tax=Sphingobium aquiterrae TaxID=2038656 RepID=UPI00301A243A
MSALVVTGTDTDIGKTVFAAGLAGALGAHYWKPVQAGVAPEGDRQTVARLSGLPAGHMLPEAYRLSTPASPHLAARIDGVEIAVERLALPAVDGLLVVEGAGGVLVPISETLTMADLFARWRAPVILCARTGLGTINHSLLSMEALRARQVPVLGIAFIGEAHAENERIIPLMAGVPSLGRLPRLDPLDAGTLAAAMRDHVDLAAIRAALA